MCACVCLCVFLGVGVGGITLRSSLLLREGEVQKKLRTLEYSGQGGCPLPSLRTIGYLGHQMLKYDWLPVRVLSVFIGYIDSPGPIMIETF